MSVRGYEYNEASKYIINQRFKINLTQNYQTFLKYLFVSPDQRPETPQAPLSDKENIEKAAEEVKAMPEFKIEDTFQMKLRKNKINKKISK